MGKNTVKTMEAPKKKIFHELYPIDITDMEDWEINRAIEEFCKSRSITSPKQQKKENK